MLVLFDVLKYDDGEEGEEKMAIHLTQASLPKWGLSADDDENEWKNYWEQNILDQNYLTFNLYFLV